MLFMLFGYTCSAQKEFNVKINFPDHLNMKKLNVFFDNGKTQKSVKKTKIKGHTIKLSGIYYAKYAIIVLRYPQSSHWNYQDMFFVKTTPAIITFHKSGIEESPFKNYTLIHAYDLADSKSKMKAFDSVEVNHLEHFVKKYGDHIFSRKDTALTQQFVRLNKTLFMKDLKYVMNNGNAYYAFLYFRRNMIHSNMFPADSLLGIFKKIFPDRYKNSIEGHTILKTLKGRINAKAEKQAPGFTAETINGKSISLKQFRNKKYVLLAFWADWCVPCIKELPILKKIRKTYPRKELAMISVAYKGDYAKYLELVKKHDMDWLNIYDNADVINAYGGRKAIPRLYLIDRSGKIIFDFSQTHSVSALQKKLQQSVLGK